MCKYLSVRYWRRQIDDLRFAINKFSLLSDFLVYQPFYRHSLTNLKFILNPILSTAYLDTFCDLLLKYSQNYCLKQLIKTEYLWSHLSISDLQK